MVRTELQANAFVVLGLAPSATNDSVIEAFEDLSADHPHDELFFVAARQTLLSPRQRLAAELGYFVDTPDSEACRLLHAVQKPEVDQSILRASTSRLSPLSRCNLLTHLVQVGPLDADLLVELVGAQAEIDWVTALRAVNHSRTAAGIVAASSTLLSEELQKVLQRQRSAIFQSPKDEVAFAEIATSAVSRILNTKDDRRLNSLGVFLEAYWQSMRAVTSPLRARLSDLSVSITTEPSNEETVDQFISTLRCWDRYARPLQMVECAKGRDDPEASDLFRLVRGLCIQLANEQMRADVSLRIATAAVEFFGELPRASERIAEDLPALRKLLADQACSDLSDLLDQTKNDVGPLVSALLGEPVTRPNGADPVLRILVQLRTTLDRIGEPILLPWILVRDLGISLFNDSHEPEASLKRTQKLLDLAAQSDAPKDVVERLRTDIAEIQTSLLEKKLASLISQKRWKEAVGQLDTIIENVTDLQSRNNYKTIRSRLTLKHVFHSLKWIALVFDAVFIGFAAINSYRTSSRYDPQISKAMAPADIASQSTTSLQTKPPINLPSGDTPPVNEYVELKPLVSDGLEPPPLHPREHPLLHVRKYQARRYAVGRVTQ